MNRPEEINYDSYKGRLSYTNSYLGLIGGIAIGLFSVITLLSFTKYFEGSPIVLWVTIIITAIIGLIARMIVKKPSKTWMACYYGLFHLLAVLFFFYVTPTDRFPAPYMLFWVILAAVTYLDIGKKVFYGSIITLVGFSTLKIVAQPAEFTPEEIWGTISFILYICYTIYYVKVITTIAAEEQTVLVSASRNIELERERLAALINSQKDAVIACDENMNIIMRNAATNLLLNTNEKLEGKNLNDLLNLSDEKGEAKSLIAEVKRNSGMLSVSNLSHYFTEDDYVNLDIFVTAIKLTSDTSGPRNYMVVLRDITKQKSMEDERDEFAAIMSHELRTPVAIAVGGLTTAQLLMDNKNYDGARESLRSAQTSVTLLQDIVGSMSMIAKNKDDVLKTEEVDPATLLKKLSNRYGLDAAEHGLELRLHIDEGISKITTNEEYLYEVLKNFVTNAIKYTEKGYVEISAKKNGEEQIIFAVKDTGIGMSTADQKHLFEKFWQSEDYRTRNADGAGIGLFISKKITDILRGAIDVNSVLGEGSTFAITLPVVYEPPRPMVIKQPEVPVEENMAVISEPAS